MATKPQKNGKLKPIRFEQFKNQLDEVGFTNLQEVILDKDDSIWIRLGNSIEVDPEDDFEDRVLAASTSQELADVILDYHPDKAIGAAEQWALCEKHGVTYDKLAMLFRAATQEQNERLGKVRPRR